MGSRYSSKSIVQPLQQMVPVGSLKLQKILKLSDFYWNFIRYFDATLSKFTLYYTWCIVCLLKFAVEP